MKTLVFAIAAALMLSCASNSYALSAADKALMQSQARAMVSQANALKAAVDALPVDQVVVTPPTTTPPPSTAWPRKAPNLLDIDLIDQDTLLNAKWLDGTVGPGFNGAAIHYGDMSGDVDSWQPFVINSKLSNPSCLPRWGVEPSGLHYLETCTDGTKEPQPQVVGCKTCRLMNWGFNVTPVKEIFWRGMKYIYPETLANATDLGIKSDGVGGTLVNGGTFAEIFEYGDKLKDPTRTGFPGQAYRYDMEAAQGVTPFPGFKYLPARWYTDEGHVKVPSCATCADGVIEFKVDGVLVYSRSNVSMGANFITAFSSQLYHGGQLAPAGILRFKVARLALSTAGWIGPAPEVN